MDEKISQINLCFISIWWRILYSGSLNKKSCTAKLRQNIIYQEEVNHNGKVDGRSTMKSTSGWRFRTASQTILRWSISRMETWNVGRTCITVKMSSTSQLTPCNKSGEPEHRRIFGKFENFDQENDQSRLTESLTTSMPVLDEHSKS